MSNRRNTPKMQPKYQKRSNAGRNRFRDLLKTPFRLGMLLLGLLLIFNIILLMSRLSSDYSGYAYEYSSMMNYLQAGDYAQVAEAVHRNEASEAKTREDTTEFVTFTRFYEAAMLEHAYEVSGDTKNAAKQQQIRDEAQAQLSGEDFTAAAENLLNSLNAE